uniref:KRAB-related domain-containing protein n=1 Tax=Colobus angolensis palliatus TaxID=336983 RepID=A0A2K5HHN3_COLAP
AFNDIAQYFSKKEKYEAMTKLGHPPPFMRNKRATDFQGNDFDNDHNGGNQVERPQMTFSKLQRILSKDPKGGNMPGPTDCVRESTTLRKMTSNSGCDTCS